jgi:RimJ/RimL family protein N-acetyltransferase
MEKPESIVSTPWDSRVFGMDTYEIKEVSEEIMRRVSNKPGHYTVKVDPLSSKKILHEHGFYYCDTLIEPYCTPERFRYFEHEDVSISRDIDVDKAAEISHGAFVHGRFHRDFNIEARLADVRYERWLREIHDSGNLLTLLFDNELAGFFGYSESRILLHALDRKFRGKGLARYLWSAACRELFDMGHEEISSSVSAANVPILNLYSSLGFRFENPKDIYHKLVKNGK